VEIAVEIKLKVVTEIVNKGKKDKRMKDKKEDQDPEQMKTLQRMRSECQSKLMY